MNRFKEWMGNVLHNCVAHPLLPFLPSKLGDAIHEWTFNLWVSNIQNVDNEQTN